MGSSEDKWLREMTSMECVSEVGHQSGTFLICYHLSLATLAPLQEHHVRQALTHLYRKVPSLRLCIGQREGTQWLKEATYDEIDFKITNGTAQDVMDNLREYRYNSASGPLWCARLLMGKTHGSTDGGSIQTSDDFPNSSNLFLGFHHAIMDGVSAMRICGLAVSLINDVIAGSYISEEQLGIHAPPDETNKLVKARAAQLKTDPDLLAKWTSELQMRDARKSLLKSIHPVVEGAEDKSLYIDRDLDASTTSQFLNKCREEGVTLHSAFTALAHIALINVLAEKGILQDSYNIYAVHVTNMRRYWQGDASQTLGCHIACLNIYTNVPRDAKKNFWNFARKVHEELQDQLKSGRMIEEEAFETINPEEQGNHDNFLEYPLPADFYTSNMGDVTSMVGEGGEHVRVTRLVRSVSIHKRKSTCSHLFHTFRGRFTHLLDYNTRHVSTQTAENYVNKVFNLLMEVLKA